MDRDTRREAAGDGFRELLRDVAGSLALVAIVALVLFAASGVWPPMVAVESGSMDPHMQKGDLVYIVESGRYTPDATGPIVTAAEGRATDYRTFSGYGNVVVYRPDGEADEVPIIHRAMFHVEEGENWYDEANRSYIAARNCGELRNCPAPNAGYITKGDANPTYDQSFGRTAPVKSRWVVGKAQFRIPWLGWIRLVMGGVA